MGFQLISSRAKFYFCKFVSQKVVNLGGEKRGSYLHAVETFYDCLELHSNEMTSKREERRLENNDSRRRDHFVLQDRRANLSFIFEVEVNKVFHNLTRRLII